MLRHKQFKGLLLAFVVIFINVNINPSFGGYIYTAHVKWEGYYMSWTEDCGDGIGNACEDQLRIKKDVTSSCSSYSWYYGSYETVYTETVSYPGFYEITWSNLGSTPCLTFYARFYENTAGYATTENSYAIRSDGVPLYAYMYLTIGSQEGYFKIKFWLTSEYTPYQ